jgi:glucosyl-dolichyl phosphate glucuronosyltransferase
MGGGDLDLAMTSYDLGMGVGLFGELVATHLIDKRRLSPGYLHRICVAGNYSSHIVGYLHTGVAPRSRGAASFVIDSLKQIVKTCLGRPRPPAEKARREAERRAARDIRLLQMKEKMRFSKWKMVLMDASILISTRNRAKYLTQTLDSISRVRRDGLEVELIIVDNGSTDETGAVVTETARRFPFRLHPLSFQCGGKAAALNYGLRTAKGGCLVFTDDDLRFDALWLLKLLAPVRAGHAEAVVGEIRLAQHLVRAWMEPLHRAMLAEVRPNDGRPRLVGANMAVSRKCFDWVAGFDPALGPGALGLAEEELLERQIRAKGGRIQFAEGAGVEHHFDPNRLERLAFVRHARASGRSNAYIFHHWDRGSRPLLAIRRAAKAIQSSFWTLYWWLGRKVGSPIDPREIVAIYHLAFLNQLAIQRGTAPKYLAASSDAI